MSTPGCAHQCYGYTYALEKSLDRFSRLSDTVLSGPSHEASHQRPPSPPRPSRHRSLRARLFFRAVVEKRLGPELSWPSCIDDTVRIHPLPSVLVDSSPTLHDIIFKALARLDHIIDSRALILYVLYYAHDVRSPWSEGPTHSSISQPPSPNRRLCIVGYPGTILYVWLGSTPRGLSSRPKSSHRNVSAVNQRNDLDVGW